MLSQDEIKQIYGLTKMYLDSYGEEKDFGFELSFKLLSNELVFIKFKKDRQFINIIRSLEL